MLRASSGYFIYHIFYSLVFLIQITTQAVIAKIIIKYYFLSIKKRYLVEINIT